MLINDTSDHQEIIIPENPEDFNEKEMLAQVSQIECAWEEVSGNGTTCQKYA